MKESVRTENRKKKFEEKTKRRQEKAAAKQILDAQKVKEDGAESDTSSLNLSSDSEDSDKLAEEDADAQNATFVTKDAKSRTEVRNLRQREDTAKYLRNLDPTSAHYDGKARIMKENPTPNLPESDQLFKGDNFVKFTGDALSVMKHEAFMINANDALKNNPTEPASAQQQYANAPPQAPAAPTGSEVNAVAMPSQIAMLYRQHENKRTDMQSTNLQSLLNKYGGESHMSLPEHLKAASKVEPEYNGVETNHDTELTGLTGIQTRYNENVHLGNHTSVWGSWFCTVEKKWGYRCCKSFDKGQVKCSAVIKEPITFKNHATPVLAAQ